MSESASSGPRHPLIRFLSLNKKTSFLGRFLLAELHPTRFERVGSKAEEDALPRRQRRGEKLERL